MKIWRYEFLDFLHSSDRVDVVVVVVVVVVVETRLPDGVWLDKIFILICGELGRVYAWIPVQSHLPCFPPTAATASRQKPRDLSITVLTTNITSWSPRLAVKGT